MSLLKGNYPVDVPDTKKTEPDAKESILEKEYYRAALKRLGGSICFVRKSKVFLWTGDENAEKSDRNDTEDKSLDGNSGEKT